MPLKLASHVARLRKAAGAVRAVVLRPRVRSEWITRLRERSAIHQDSSTTALDRYPQLFASARDVIGTDCGNILSFGCSSGEEVVTLRRYFPHARIVGAELNRALLETCRRLDIPGEVQFIHSSHDNVAEAGPYDLVFCMAVLQRRPHHVADSGMLDISKHYPFALFTRELEFLVAQLRIGGLLVVENCQYCVEDLQEALGLEPVPDSAPIARWPRFRPDGSRIDPAPNVSRIFRRKI